jgi:hypothetical protein
MHWPNIIAGHYLEYLLSQDNKTTSHQVTSGPKQSAHNRTKVKCSTCSSRPSHCKIYKKVSIKKMSQQHVSSVLQKTLFESML